MHVGSKPWPWAHLTWVGCPQGGSAQLLLEPQPCSRHIKSGSSGAPPKMRQGPGGGPHLCTPEELKSGLGQAVSAVRSEGT